MSWPYKKICKDVIKARCPISYHLETVSYKGLIRYLETNNLLAEFLSASLFQILEKLQANLCFLFIIWYKFQSSSWQNFSSWRLLINVHKPLGTNFILQHFEYRSFFSKLPLQLFSEWLTDCIHKHSSCYLGWTSFT